MKKKVLLITAIVAMLAIMVSGTLAYFTAEDSVTNTFTIGSVKIEIYENDVATESDTMAFGKLTPIVEVDDPSQDVSYIPKAVDVKNTGKNSAYVRTYIAIPEALVTYLCLDLNLTDSGWVSPRVMSATVGGVDYAVYSYDYNAAIAPDTFTNELLKGVYLASDVDLKENANGNLEFVRRGEGYELESGVVAHTKKTDGGYQSEIINVLVASQAIQADGFADYEDALDNFTTHPWAN